MIHDVELHRTLKGRPADGRNATGRPADGPGATSRNEQVGITCLRGFAALWVVLYHYARHFGASLEDPFSQRGHLAVDIFFVLSGFILAYVYLDDVRSGAFRYRDFLVKRLARLYPVHLVTMLLAFAMLAVGSAVGLTRSDLSDEAAALVPTALMLHAYGIMPALHLNFPSWSISAEFFAYLLFPLLATLLLRARFPLLVGLAALGLTVAVTARLHVPLFELTSASLPRILPEFILGVGLFMAVRGRRPGTPLVAAALAAPAAAWFGPDWLLVFGFAAMIAGLFWANPILSGARLAPLVHLGQISYAVYMVHGLLEMVMFKAIGRLSGHPDTDIPLVFLPLAIAAAVAGGHWLHRLVETPGRRVVLAALAPRRRLVAA